MKKRKDSFFGLHFDFHATPKFGVQGKDLREEDIREICRRFRPDFIQIDCKGHPGWTSYPSKLGNAMPEFEKDTLALWRRVTKEEDVALYMHYSGVYDTKYCDEHPEETAMDAEGGLIAGTTRLGGKYVDDLMLPQLFELIESYGVDGFWVDGECWKAQPDFHPESLKAFEEATGIDLGGQIPGRRGDPYFEEYREYHRELFRRQLRYYVDAIHEKHPHVQIASNWAFSDHMPERISANVDFLSGDLNPANSLESARYAARALAQHEFPWDLMSWNFRIQVGQTAAKVAKHQSQILQEAAAVISLGGGYQNYIMQHEDCSPNMTDLRGLDELAGFLRARQPYSFGGKAVHQAALLLSTYDRAHETDRLWLRNGYEKIMGMSSLLGDVGQSFEIVCEHTLEKYCREYRMIVIPETYLGLEEKTVEMLLSYAREGGNLVLIGSNTCSVFAQAGVPLKVLCEGADAAGEGMRFDIGHAGNANAQSKPYFFTLDGARHGVVFHPVSLSAEEGKVLARFGEKQADTEKALARRLSYGKGSITSLGVDLGSQYLSGRQYMHRDLMHALVDDLYESTVRLESACGMLEVTCLEKDGKLLIQLLNVGGSHGNPNVATDDYLPPVLDVFLSMKLPKTPTKLLLQPEGRKLRSRELDGRLWVEIDRIDIHSVLEILY